VNQIVSFSHVFWDAESIHQTVDELLVLNWLAKVVQLSSDPVEVV
jgi:hypothetical protein